MTLESLKDAVGLLRHPLSSGRRAAVMGGFLFATATIAESQRRVFYAEPLDAPCLSLVIPFLAGGIYGTVRGRGVLCRRVRAVRKTYYFRIPPPVACHHLCGHPDGLPGSRYRSRSSAPVPPLVWRRSSSGCSYRIVFFTFFLRHRGGCLKRRTSLSRSGGASSLSSNNRRPHHPLLPGTTSFILIALWFGRAPLSGPRYS